MRLDEDVLRIKPQAVIWAHPHEPAVLFARYKHQAVDVDRDIGHQMDMQQGLIEVERELAIKFMVGFWLNILG